MKGEPKSPISPAKAVPQLKELIKTHPATQPKKAVNPAKGLVPDYFRFGPQQLLEVTGEDDQTFSYDDGQQMNIVRRFFARYSNEDDGIWLETLLEELATEWFNYASDRKEWWEAELLDVISSARDRGIVAFATVKEGNSKKDWKTWVSSDTSSISDYSPLGLVATLVMMAPKTEWIEREELLYLSARGLGFARVGANIRTAFKSAFTSAIRRGFLEYEGDRVRRARG